MSLLEPHHRRDGVDPGAHDEPDVASDGGEDWEVEAILDQRHVQEIQAVPGALEGLGTVV